MAKKPNRGGRTGRSERTSITIRPEKLRVLEAVAGVRMATKGEGSVSAALDDALEGPAWDRLVKEAAPLLKRR